MIEENKKYKYIQNHDIHNNICKYSLEDGSIKEVYKSDIGEIETDRGFYVKVEDKYIGVFASEEGPVLFFGNERYLLEKGKYEFQLKRGKDMNEFIFKKDSLTIEIKYPAVKNTNYDLFSPYNDEEMLDFFTWLSAKQERGKFYIYYTI